MRVTSGVSNRYVGTSQNGDEFFIDSIVANNTTWVVTVIAELIPTVLCAVDIAFDADCVNLNWTRKAI